MARNYSFAEAVEILVHGADLEACADIGKRYPLLAQKVTKVGVKAGEDFVDLAGFIPEHISANKVNTAIKRMLEEAADAEDDEDEDAEEEAPKKKAKKEPVKKTGKAGRPKKVEEEDEDDDDDAETDYDSMTNAKMYKLLGEMGKRKDCKEKYGDLSHDSMLKYLKKYGTATAEADDEDEDEAEDEAADYTGMKAMELYKLCKQRKIKAEAKKPAKYYIDLLKKADAAEAEDADDEDWEDDEEQEEEAPKKSAKKADKKADKKAVKKTAKKSEPEEDEDDDDDDDDEWDI